MSETLIVYLDRLKSGAVLKLSARLSPAFLELQEKDLLCEDPVEVEGSAYLTEDDLVIRFSASTTIKMACSICNNLTSVPLSVKNYYHTEQLQGVKNAQYDCKELLREALLVELPKLAECQGRCPERPSIDPYLHKEKQEEDPTVYFPFSDLNNLKE